MSHSSASVPSNTPSVLHEDRVFPPPEEFSRRARIQSLEQYRRLYDESISAPEQFWAKQATEELVWSKPWHDVLQLRESFAKPNWSSRPTAASAGVPSCSSRRMWTKHSA